MAGDKEEVVIATKKRKGQRRKSSQLSLEIYNSILINDSKKGMRLNLIINDDERYYEYYNKYEIINKKIKISTPYEKILKRLFFKTKSKRLFFEVKRTLLNCWY